MLDLAATVPAAVRRALTGGGGGSRLLGWSVLAVLAVVVATVLLVAAVLRAPERLAPAAQDPAPRGGAVIVPEPARTRSTAGPSVPPPSVSPRPSAGPRRPPTTRPSPTATPAGTPNGAAPSRPAPPAPAALDADFAIEKPQLLNYSAAVTISNPGPVPVTGWTLVLTLPRDSLGVTHVAGAYATGSGATWTFVPDGTTGRVAGQGQVRVTFRVTGPPQTSAPTACTVDGTACGGVAG
ncbi:Cellulose binding domain-containing protein [Micromonospora halophytica]|uniref:Cellulose binding domain-containing protein n=1 Tax=Micromonospora halophytica TaxID=47864 RepID=A0A1C5H426_9ACTN|nr:Cellulose binding domain-containing protein [Micromonospora halophytica]